MVRDPGTFWHTVVGQRILDTGQVVRNDPFSFTFPGEPWIAQSWLAECVMAAIRRGGGWDMLLGCAVVLLAAVYAAVAGRLLRAGLRAAPGLVVLMLVVAAGSPQFHLRPLVISTGLFYATVALLTDVENGRRSAGRLGWLVPLCAVWANCHGGVLAGLGSIVLVGGGWYTAGLLGGASPVRCWKSRLTTGGVLLGCGLALLANPYGVEMLRDWGRILSLPLGDLIEEHAPLSFRQPVGWIVLGLATVYVATLAGTYPRRPRVTWLLPLVWLALAIHRGRNAQLFAISMAIAWADLLPHSRVATWLAGRGLFAPREESRASARPQTGLRPAAISLAASLVAVLPMIGVWPRAEEGRWVRLDPSRWPVEVLPDLEQIQRDEPPGTPIFNDMLFGGFLIEHAPRLRVFIDDRCELYGRDFLLAYDRARRLDPAQLDGWSAAYGFRYALVESGGNFDRHLRGRSEWSLVRRARAAALYRRVGQASSLSPRRAGS